MDPMADAIARFSVFLCFLWSGYAYLWMVVLIFYREFIVAYIRVAVARSGIVLAVRLSGKLKAVTQGVAILAILILILMTPPVRVQTTWTIAHGLMGLVVLVTLWSGVDYVRMSLPALRGLLRRNP